MGAPPGHVDVKVLAAQGQPHPFFQDGHQERHPARVHAHALAPGLRQGGRGDQGLDLHQDGAGTFQAGNDCGAGDFQRAFGHEQPRRIGHLLEPRLLHLEDPHLVCRAVPVLYGAKQPEGVRAVAFEIEDRVHQVLERPGPGDGPFLGDVPDEEVVVMPVSSACCTRRKAVSRTWVREPGAAGRVAV